MRMDASRARSQQQTVVNDLLEESQLARDPSRVRRGTVGLAHRSIHRSRARPPSHRDHVRARRDRQERDSRVCTSKRRSSRRDGRSRRLRIEVNDELGVLERGLRRGSPMACAQAGGSSSSAITRSRTAWSRSVFSELRAGVYVSAGPPGLHVRTRAGTPHHCTQARRPDGGRDRAQSARSEREAPRRGED